MGRIFFYKLTADVGAAPCVQRGLLSLAICKPMIRRSAKIDDLIFGFTANSLDTRNRSIYRNRLIYVARITDKLCDGEYYKGDKYTSRDDCIYTYSAKQFRRRKDAKFHLEEHDLAHDLGNPPEYPRANVLLSSDFRYFGIAGTDDYKSEFAEVRKAVESLGRGHHVKLGPTLRDEFLAMKRWIWKKSRNKVCGSPTNPPSGRSCHRARYWRCV